MTSAHRDAQTTAPNLPLTYLFVPGNRPDRFDKAVASRAGAVIVDLEDAVAPEDKAAARASFASWYGTCGAAGDRILVRINDDSTPWHDEDIALVAETGVRGVVLPKTERAAQIDRVVSALPASGFAIPLVETARGVADVDTLARAARVQRIAFGTLDYALDLDLTGDERGFIYPACRIAVASRAAAIAPPIAGVTSEIGDEAKLRADLEFARACGFGAKLCIHPKQVDAIHAALRPSESEIAWAKEVAAIAESSPGAVQVAGKMVDRPVIAKALRILARA
ncbi:MAG TPA: CoA ester lyase [Casimicrobiaceae bacterium]|nr:CoA ester lyase [Casimicrobiaceae bacterium]